MATGASVQPLTILTTGPLHPLHEEEDALDITEYHCCLGPSFLGTVRAISTSPINCAAHASGRRPGQGLGYQFIYKMIYYPLFNLEGFKVLLKTVL